MNRTFVLEALIVLPIPLYYLWFLRQCVYILHAHSPLVRQFPAIVLFICITVGFFLPHAVAALSQLETLTGEMARVATMELVDFWQFMEILTAQVFKKFNKQFSQKVCVSVYVVVVYDASFVLCMYL